MRELIATQYAVEAQNHSAGAAGAAARGARRDRRADRVCPTSSRGGRGGVLAERRARRARFCVWSQTVLARARLTSAVELYDARATLVSRFALNFPEYTGTAQTPQPTLAVQVGRLRRGAPFGAEERSMLHAEREHLRCVDGAGAAVVGTIVVHVVFDYRTLPFITSQSPYFEVFRPTEAARRARARPAATSKSRSTAGASTPIYTSGRARGRSPTRCSRASTIRREPFWTDSARRRALQRATSRTIACSSTPRLPGADAVRSPRPPGRADDAGGRRLRARADRHGAVHARRPRAAARRPRAAARDPRELLPQAVPRVRAGVDHPGADPGAGDPHVLREPAARRRRRPRRRARPPSPSASSRSRTRCSAAAPKASRRSATT